MFYSSTFSTSLSMSLIERYILLLYTNQPSIVLKTQKAVPHPSDEVHRRRELDHAVFEIEMEIEGVYAPPAGCGVVL